MKKILLTRGQYALVDDEDYEELSKYKWHARKHRNTYYAQRTVRKSGEKSCAIQMHRVVTQVNPDMQVDHIDHNGLNNTKSNLRKCTHSQNIWNRGKRCNNTSGYKGVSFYKPRKNWVAQITKNGKKINLGYFKTPQAAYFVYCTAVKDLHGEFANFG